MDDRTLLELAAKAFGITIDRWHEDNNGVPVIIYVNGRGGHSFWQPLLENALTDCMGDALRLANRLKLNVMHGDYSVGVHDERDVDEGALLKSGSAEERGRVTRRLIVRAAAALAEQRTGGRE